MQMWGNCWPFEAINEVVHGGGGGGGWTRSSSRTIYLLASGQSGGDAQLELTSSRGWTNSHSYIISLSNWLTYSRQKHLGTKFPYPLYQASHAHTRKHYNLRGLAVSKQFLTLNRTARLFSGLLLRMKKKKKKKVLQKKKKGNQMSLFALYLQPKQS